MKYKELPNFSLSLLNGENLWSENLRGKPTVINFWNTDCQPCINETATLNELKKEYGDQVNFIAITSQNEKDVIRFLEHVPFNFEHIINAKKYIHELNIWSQPKTLILDSDLIIHYIGKPKKYETIAEEISNHLEFKKEIKSHLKEMLDFY